MTRSALALTLFAALAAAVGPPPRRLDPHGDPLPPGAQMRLGTLRWRAVGEVQALAFSPDGQTLAALSQDGLCLFDRAGRRLVHVPPAGLRPGESPGCLTFSPDGKQLACRTGLDAGNSVKTVAQVYDLPSGRLAAQHDADKLQWLGWRGGRLHGVILAKGALLWRELASGKERRLEAADLPDVNVGRVECRFAAGTLAAADTKGVVHLWDVDKGEKALSLDAKAGFYTSLALRPDGRVLATLNWNAAKDGITLWDAASGKPIRTVATGLDAVYLFTFSADGKALATQGDDVRLWAADTGKLLARTTGSAGRHRGLALRPDGKVLATAEPYGGTIRLWDAATGAAVPAPAGHAGPPALAGWSRDGRRVIAVDHPEGAAVVWDAATGKPVGRIHREKSLRGAALAPDGETLFACWDDGELRGLDATTGRERFAVKLEDPDQPKGKQWVRKVAVADDGKSVVTFSTSPALGGAEPPVLISAFDTTGKLLYRRRAGDETWYAVSADATMRAVPKGGTDIRRGIAPGMGPVRVEDVRSGETLVSIPYLPFQTWAVTFSPDGRLLVTATYSLLPLQAGERRHRVARTLRLWELASGGEVLALPTTMNERAAFSPDGSVLAFSAEGGEVRLWDLRGGRERLRLAADAAVASLAFSPDGARLASGLHNTTVLIWDVAGPKRAAQRLDAKALARAWDELAREPKLAFAARGTLALSPADAVQFLAKKLEPVEKADAAAVKRLIAELDSDGFATREKARRELEKLGDAAVGALRATLNAKPSVEAYRRIEALLKRDSWPLADRDALRRLRGVAVLEDIGDAAAVRHLRALAAGAAGARLTEDATAALARLARRTAHRP